MTTPPRSLDHVGGGPAAGGLSLMSAPRPAADLVEAWGTHVLSPRDGAALIGRLVQAAICLACCEVVRLAAAAARAVVAVMAGIAPRLSWPRGRAARTATPAMPLGSRPPDRLTHLNVASSITPTRGAPTRAGALVGWVAASP